MTAIDLTTEKRGKYPGWLSGNGPWTLFRSESFCCRLEPFRVDSGEGEPLDISCEFWVELVPRQHEHLQVLLSWGELTVMKDFMISKIQRQLGDSGSETGEVLTHAKLFIRFTQLLSEVLETSGGGLRRFQFKQIARPRSEKFRRVRQQLKRYKTRKTFWNKYVDDWIQEERESRKRLFQESAWQILNSEQSPPPPTCVRLPNHNMFVVFSDHIWSPVTNLKIFVTDIGKLRSASWDKRGILLVGGEFGIARVSLERGQVESRYFLQVQGGTHHRGFNASLYYGGVVWATHSIQGLWAWTASTPMKEGVNLFRRNDSEGVRLLLRHKSRLIFAHKNDLYGIYLRAGGKPARIYTTESLITDARIDQGNLELMTIEGRKHFWKPGLEWESVPLETRPPTLTFPGPTDRFLDQKLICLAGDDRHHYALGFDRRVLYRCSKDSQIRWERWRILPQIAQDLVLTS
jgi:hypothetical protein